MLSINTKRIDRETSFISFQIVVICTWQCGLRLHCSLFFPSDNSFDVVLCCWSRGGENKVSEFIGCVDCIWFVSRQLFFTLSTRVLCFFASVNAVSLMWKGVILIIDFCVCFFASLVTKEDVLHPPLAIAIPVLHHWHHQQIAHLKIYLW